MPGWSRFCMKQFLLTLLQRPSTWVGALSATLLVVVLMAPGPEREDVRSVEGRSPLPEGKVEPVEDVPLAPAPEDLMPKLAQVEAPPPKMPEPPALPPAPVPVPVPEVAVVLPKAIAIEPIQGPPDLTVLQQIEAAWASSYHGVPNPEKVAALVQAQFQGPPDLADLTRSWVAVQVGPPSPAEMGPPVLAMMPGAAKAAATDDKAGAKLAESKSALQKPTTRITPPATPAVPEAQVTMSKDVEPEPPPLNEEELPPAQGNVWKVVKVDGREYVTGESMRLFYRFSTHKVDGKHVWFRNPNLIIKGQVGSQEMLVNNIKFILSYPVLYQGGQALFSRLDLCKLIEPVIRPSYIGSSSTFDTVVLDAGHGGHDSGAKGVYGYEKNYALAMVFAVREALVKRGFKVILTRSNDTFLSLTSRVAVANKTPNSIFISIHFNSGGSAASGIETFALTPQGSASSVARGGGFSNTARMGNQYDSENIALATAVHAQVVHRFKLIDRGIKRARWTVLTGCTRPSILFEGGFVTNSRECQLIASDQYRKALSEAIGDAVTNYRRALAPKSVGR